LYNKVVKVVFKAIDSNDVSREAFIDEFTFEIEFKYTVFEKCYESKLVTSDTIGRQEISLFGDPITF